MKSGEVKIERVELDIVKIEIKEKRVFLDRHIF